MLGPLPSESSYASPRFGIAMSPREDPALSDASGDDRGAMAWFYVACGIVAALGLTYVLVMLTLQGVHAMRLEYGGQVTGGVLTKSATRTLKRTLPAEYEFEVGGETYRGVGGRTGERGDPISIRYLPHNPSVHRPHDGILLDVVLGAGSFPLLCGMVFGASKLLKAFRADRDDVSDDTRSDAAAL